MNIESKLFSKMYYMKFSDGSTWAVPVSHIIIKHSEWTANTRGGDALDYMESITIPHFEGDNNNIEYWAKKHLRWSDVVNDSIMVKPANLVFDDEWKTAPVKIA